MADIFLSYAREDITIAERIEAALRERGWTVFRDRQLHGGLRFDQVISDELRSARCVVVLWSEASIASEWVIAEADDAQRAWSGFATFRRLPGWFMVGVVDVCRSGSTSRSVV